jgi:hypothetical protein
MLPEGYTVSDDDLRHMQVQHRERGKEPAVRLPGQDARPRRNLAQSVLLWMGVVLSSAVVLFGGALAVLGLYAVEQGGYDNALIGWAGICMGIIPIVLGVIGLFACLNRLGLGVTKGGGSRRQIDLVQNWSEEGRPDSLRHANLRRADLRGVQLGPGQEGGSGADLSRAVLSEANLCGADLRRANLGKADLTFANLSEAALRGAILRNAYLGSADLTRADLSESDLTKADLRGANLDQAKLTGVSLEGANLSRANLTGVIVSDAQLAQAGSLKGATLPDGSVHE